MQPEHRVLLELTDEQRHRIRELTGLDTPVIAFNSGARLLHCRFAGLELEVLRGVFPPQAVSEQLVATALHAVAEDQTPVLIDVGTGCGAVALALVAARGDAVVYATEISSRALACARRNRHRLALNRVKFRSGPLLDPLPAGLRGRVSAIVSNLPYLPSDLTAAHGEWWPDGTASGTDADGLGLLRSLADQARAYLRPGGWLVLQLLASQWDGFAQWLSDRGYESTGRLERAGSRIVIGRARLQAQSQVSSLTAARVQDYVQTPR